VQSDDDAAPPPNPARDASRDGRAPGDEADVVVGDDDGSTSVACLIASGITFTTKGSVLLTSNGVEYRQLVAEIPSVGQIRLAFWKGAPGTFAPGTFSLACTPGSPCTTGSVYTAHNGQYYGPSKGTITVSTLLSPASNEMTGTLKGLEFRHLVEVPVPDAALSTYDEIDPNVACVTVPDMSFDTTAPIGTACVDHDECGTTKVCSIASMTCQQSECASPGQCASGQVCSKRSDTVGFCAIPCDPFTPCGSGYACEGNMCKHAGTATPGATCIPYRDVQTGCQAGLVCKQDESDPLHPTTSCVQGCNSLVAAPGCSASQRCIAYGYCDAPLPANEVATGALDQTCTLPPPVPGMPQLSSAPCADDGQAYRGLCASESSGSGLPSQAMCRRACDPKGPACPTGQSCRVAMMAMSGINYVCR
jgi:hypothetical protein